MAIAYRSMAPFSARAIIDACRPFEFLDEFPAVVEASPELKEQVRKKWKQLF